MNYIYILSITFWGNRVKLTGKMFFLKKISSYYIFSLFYDIKSSVYVSENSIWPFSSNNFFTFPATNS